MKILFAYLSAGLLIVGGVASVLLFTPLGERPLTALFAVGDVKSVDFEALELKDKPNQFLMCPPGFCAATPHAESPVFDVSVEQLRNRWREVVAAQPRMELLAEDEDGQQFDYVQRSARFRFPDVITVRFIPGATYHADAQSTLAIYSRSIYGKSDFGVNRARVKAWLDLLRAGL